MCREEGNHVVPRCPTSLERTGVRDHRRQVVDRCPGDVAQRHPPGTTRAGVGDGNRRRECEPALADTRVARHGHEPMLARQVGHRRDASARRPTKELTRCGRLPAAVVPAVSGGKALDNPGTSIWTIPVRPVNPFRP